MNLERVEFEITLRPIPGNWRTPPLLRLRALLKAALRAYGFRATVCRPVAPTPVAAPDAGEGTGMGGAMNRRHHGPASEQHGALWGVSRPKHSKEFLTGYTDQGSTSQPTLFKCTVSTDFDY